MSNRAGVIDYIIAAAIVASTAFIIVAPALSQLYVRAERSAIDEATDHLVQFEAFYQEKVDVSGEWRYRVESYREGLLRGYYDVMLDESQWDSIGVPFLRYATRLNSSLWLRKHFYAPPELAGKKVKLVFWGAWHRAEVWLNGIYLGGHEGYFSPFYFEVGRILNYGGDNVLAVFLESPVELDLSNKRSIMGVFNDWDCKPYPSWALGKLPPRFEWAVPIGLWRPVELLVSGPLSVDLLLVDARVGEASQPAEVRVRALVSNSAGNEVRGRINYSIGLRGHPPSVRGTVEVDVAPDEKKWIEYTVQIEGPKLWRTWDYGSPNLYEMELEAYVGDELQGSQRVLFGIRRLSWDMGGGRFVFYLNGRRIFLRGANYISNFNLSKSTREFLERDLGLLREANMNFVRVHAHVEPFEFYRLANEAGVLVQADLPLIWSYMADARGRDLEDFRYRAQVMAAEVVLLLYNNPSIAIWTIHNEPPWASEWMGSLYRRGVDRELDYTLRQLVSVIDDSRLIITASGREDQHLYHGWYYGSWEDYRKAEAPFPSEFGAQSLPSYSSPFWRELNISEWPIRPNSPEYYEMVYRDFQPDQWRTYGVGPPESYSNLSSYIEASQEYQATILKTAIERFRLLKFNTTGGTAVFMLTDCHPGITWSIVDYYRFPKKAYRVVRNAYNPLHAIIEWRGEDEIRGSTVIYEPNTTAVFNLWIVNDDPKAPRTARLEWEIVDVNTSVVLERGAEPLDIPREVEPARLAKSIGWSVPSFFDGDHVVELRTFIKAGGGILDTNYFRAVVRGSSQIVARLNVEEDLLFAVQTGRGVRLVKSSGGLLSFAVPRGSRVRILGPVMGGGRVYFPVGEDLGVVGEPRRAVNITLVPGGVVNFISYNPMIGRDEPPIPDIQVFEVVGGDLHRLETPERRELMLLNVSPFSAIVPARTPLVLRVYVYGEQFNFGSIDEPVILEPGQSMLADSVADYLTAQDLSMARRELSKVERMVSELRSRGFYLGLELGELRRAEELLNLGGNLTMRKEYHEAAGIIREAHELLTGIGERAAGLRASVRGSYIPMFFLSLLASIGISSMLVEDEQRRAVVSIVVLVVVQLVVSRTYPGLVEISYADLLIGIYLAIILFMAILILPRITEGFKSEKEVPLLVAASMALSLATRNLRRRRLRSILVLTALVAMVVSITNLSSMSFQVSSREVVTTRIAQRGESLVMFFKDNGYFDLSDFYWISDQKESAKVGFKVDSLPRRQPYVEEPVVIRGFVGIDRLNPQLEELARAVSPREALERLLAEPYTCLVPAGAASFADIRIGDRIRVGGAKLVVVGFFDSDALRAMREAGGYNWTPLTVRPWGEVGPVGMEELVITNSETALMLGGAISKIYVYTNTPEDAIQLAKKLSLLNSYVAYVEPSGENVRVIARLQTLRFYGGEALIPMLLVMLNISVMMVSSVYERRGEIFTLASVGLNPSHIFAIFLSESFVLGLVGGTFGYILGTLIFSVMNLADVRIPVNAKTSVADMELIVGASLLTAVTAAVIPAIRASRLATPSLRRRWKLEAERVGERGWLLEIPARIPLESAEAFVDYIYERLREEEGGLEINLSNVSMAREASERGAVYKITFTYSRGGSNPFKSDTTLLVERKDGYYGVSMLAMPFTPYGRVMPRHIREVGTFVRALVFEWAALRIRLLIPVGRSPDNVIELIKMYNPQLVILVSRMSERNVLRTIRRELRSRGIRPPAMNFVKVSGKIDDIVSRLAQEVDRVDLVCIDSDDGVLSTAAMIAAALKDRRACVMREGRAEEINPRKLFVES